MKSTRLTLIAAIAVLAPIAVAPLRIAAQNRPQNHKQTQYDATNLGTLGGSASSAHGINNKSWITGVANVTGDLAEHASLWRDGVITDLGTLGGINSNVDFPVKNNSGVIAGFSQTSSVDPLGENFCIFVCTQSGGSCGGSNLSCRGFVWRDGVMDALGTLGGNNSAATAINNRDLIVGTAENRTVDPNCIPPQALDYEAVVWDPLKDETRELPGFPGDSIGAAAAINDNAQVAGGSGSCGSGPGIGPIFAHALLWQDNSVTDLGTLGGVMNNLAYAINNRGQVAGASDLPGDNTGHAFLWQDGTITDLGTLPGDVLSAAFGMNDNGQIVGLSCDSAGNCRAFLWQNGVMTDLNTLIPNGSTLYLIEGADINNKGEIVGQALDESSGNIVAFSAAPTGKLGSRASTKMILPDSVRAQLQQRRGIGRFGTAPKRLP